MEKVKNFTKEFIIFGLKQARACIFAGSFFVLLFLSHHITIPGLPRYDFLFLGAVLLQIILVATKIETKDELKTILVFHVIGFALEAFKTHPSIASWHYPEFGYFKILNVPLYSGFMYAAIGSYIAQAWRIFKLHLTHVPPYWLTVTLSGLIYINFYTHHYIPDFRYVLIVLVFALFGQSWVEYTVIEKRRRMPMILSFGLIAFFIWIAENMGSFLGAWKYPEQMVTWTTVSTTKITSWFLLVIISYFLIAYLKMVKEKGVQGIPSFTGVSFKKLELISALRKELGEV